MSTCKYGNWCNENIETTWQKPTEEVAISK